MSFKSKNVLVQQENNEFLQNLENKKIIKKSVLRKIEILELPEKQPNFKNSLKTKDAILAEWLMEWIDTRLAQGRLNVNDLLPAKKVLSEKTKVSMGTVQTAIRIIEDYGYVASKQRIGTFILDRNIVSEVPRKQTSKREQTIENLKKFIVNRKYQTGDVLPSSRELSKTIGSAPNTTRLALEYLAKAGTIQSKAYRGNKSNWIIKIIPEIFDNMPENENSLESDTLVNQIERDLKELISKNYKVGDKLISHYELTDILKVSIKTIHDAMKRLVEQGILQSKRGRYGTYILRMPSDKQIMTGKESEIFAPAVEASLYNYERVESYLKEFIKQNYKVGDKLPAMGKLAVEFNVSSNTIRKALQKLAEEDIVKFSRGRYGGTFLVKIPEEQSTKGEKATLSWLSLNLEYVSAYNRKN